MKEENEIGKTPENNCVTSELAPRHLPVSKPHYTSSYDDESWEVSVRLPGVRKENVSVTVENEVLEIAATRSTDLPESWKPLREYPSSRQYLLRLDVGPEVNASGISAILEDGVMTLRLPLKEEVKPVTIEVN